MGSEHSKKNNKKTNLNDNENNLNEPGEDYYLEDWTIYNDKNKNIDNSIKFNNDLLISEVNKNPFNDYEIIKTLGEGAFGEVHLVKHNLTKAIRAMKVIKKMDDFENNNDQDLLNEINVLKKIDHPNVIKIFEFFFFLLFLECSLPILFCFILF